MRDLWTNPAFGAGVGQGWIRVKYAWSAENARPGWNLYSYYI